MSPPFPTWRNSAHQKSAVSISLFVEMRLGRRLKKLLNNWLAYVHVSRRVGFHLTSVWGLFELFLFWFSSFLFLKTTFSLYFVAAHSSLHKDIQMQMSRCFFFCLAGVVDEPTVFVDPEHFPAIQTDRFCISHCNCFFAILWINFVLTLWNLVTQQVTTTFSIAGY